MSVFLVSGGRWGYTEGSSSRKVAGHWDEAEEVVGCSSIERHSKHNRTEPWVTSDWAIELGGLERSPSALIILQFQNEILLVPLLYCCLNQK